MTREELQRKLSYLKYEALRMVKNSSPVRTGNLQNSVYVRDLPNGGFEVYIDTTQAPYAQYTLEQWTHGRYKSKQNPNEGWAYEASKEFMELAKTVIGGK